MKHVRILGFLIIFFAACVLSSSSVFAQNGYDPDSEIIVRKAPIMPPSASRSGECEIRYDITPAGLTTNIHVLRCTETLFARSSSRALSRWRYKPADRGRVGLEVKITYRMVGQDGEMLPAAPMPRRAENPEVLAFLKSGGKTLKSKRKGADNFCCLKHSVGVDGRIFNREWKACPYKGSTGSLAERLAKMTFKPAIDAGEAVVSDGYQSIFWFYKDKAYTGSREDIAYCAAE